MKTALIILLGCICCALGAAVKTLETISLMRGGTISVDTSQWEVVAGQGFGAKTELMIFHKTHQDLRGFVFAGSPQEGVPNIQKKCAGPNKSYSASPRPLCQTWTPSGFELEFNHAVTSGKQNAYLNYVISFSVPVAKKQEFSAKLNEFQVNLGAVK